MNEKNNLKDLLEGLNSEQKEAVTHREGPLLVVAGAGTGKTRVIIRRIAHLIAAKTAKPGEILALTFTDKAAEEMEFRVDQLVPYGYIDVNISTFHAFGDRVLREFALAAGLPADFKVMSAADQLVFLREHVFALPLLHYKSLSDPTRHLEAVLNVISRAQDEDISPEEYLEWAEKKGSKVALSKVARGKKNIEQAEKIELAEKQLEIARVYQKYQELKIEKGVVDFADQVGMCIKLLRQHPSILKKVRERCRYILVDEFQDTNYSQFELLKLLAGKEANLMVVGDDDQSIYRFRGAAISNILNFTSVFKQSKKVVLTKNYRSAQIILDTSRRLIKHNDPDRLEIKEGIDKQLIAMCEPEKRRVEHKHFDKEGTEADWVARKIQEGQQAGRKFSDFAILVRAKAHAEQFRQSLNMLGVPYQFSGGGGLYNSSDVKLAVAFLRVVGDPSDSPSFYYIANSWIYNVPALDIQKLNSFAKRRNYTLHYVYTHLNDGGEEFEILQDISEDARQKIRKLMEDIQYYTDFAASKTTGELLYHFLTRSKYLGHLLSESQENDGRIRALGQFFARIKEFRQIAQLDRVTEFIRHLKILKDAGENPETVTVDPDIDAVSILTVHKAKGLEFKVVFMGCLVAERFPVRRRGEPIELPPELVDELLTSGDFHMQEERRLFYVGMTRAREELYLTSAADYGGTRLRKVSPFVLEALDTPKADITLVKKGAADQIELFAQTEIERPQFYFHVKADEPLPLSFNQIEDYNICPQKYKYVHLLKIPLLPNDQIVYGDALHKAVQVYNQARLNGLPFSQEELIASLVKRWSSQGFISREHEEQRLEKAKSALADFYQREQASKRDILYVEEEFSLSRDNIILRGRWDRVDRDRVRERNEEKKYIVDFKTSEVKKVEEAVRKAAESLQLSIYALVWKERFGTLPHKVELHFLENGLIGSVEKDEDNLAKTWEKVCKVATGIRAGEFRAKPNAFACGYCAYKEICPSSNV